MEAHIVESKTYQDFEKSLNNKKIVKALWCTNPECEEHLKNKINGVKTLVIPIEQGKISGSCIICNKEAKKFTYFGRSY
jgi:prolyl-tRNA synthetase